MRVAILNRPREWHPGGDLVSIDHRMAALRSLGVEVKYVTDGNLAGFDLAHVFHIDFDWCRSNFYAVQVAGLPYVVTPVFFPELSHCGMGLEVKAQVLKDAAAILPFSRREGEEIRQHFGFDLEYEPIPEGTAQEFHAISGSERQWVCACDWGGSKRSGVIEEACRRAELPFALLRSIPYADMPAMYRKCRVFATASTSDRMSLAVGEALCSGCRVLSSSANRGNEWYPGLEIMDAAATVEQWAERIKAAYEADIWDWASNRAARNLTWTRTAQLTKAVYERVLQ